MPPRKTPIAPKTPVEPLPTPIEKPAAPESAKTTTLDPSPAAKTKIERTPLATPLVKPPRTPLPTPLRDAEIVRRPRTDAVPDATTRRYETEPSIHDVLSPRTKQEFKEGLAREWKESGIPATAQKLWKEDAAGVLPEAGAARKVADDVLGSTESPRPTPEAFNDAPPLPGKLVTHDDAASALRKKFGADVVSRVEAKLKQVGDAPEMQQKRQELQTVLEKLKQPAKPITPPDAEKEFAKNLPNLPPPDDYAASIKGNFGGSADHAASHIRGVISHLGSNETSRHAYLRDVLSYLDGAKPGTHEKPAPEHFGDHLNKMTPTPPPKEGHVRFYHGGHDEPGSENDPRWFTQQHDYAQGYADKTPGAKVSYLDLPEDHPFLSSVGRAYNDDGLTQRAPYNHFEAPPEIARGRRPFVKPAEDDIAPNQSDKTPKDHFFRESKVKKPDGTLIPVYHGTARGVFRNRKTLPQADAVSQFRSGPYDIMQKMRKGEELSPEQTDRVRLVNQFATENKLPESMTLYRKVGDGVELKPGDVFSDKAPLFATPREDHATNIATKGESKLIKILADKGASAGYINGGEGPEIILPSNAKLRIVSVGKDGVVAKYEAEEAKTPLTEKEEAKTPLETPLVDEAKGEAPVGAPVEAPVGKPLETPLAEAHDVAHDEAHVATAADKPANVVADLVKSIRDKYPGVKLDLHDSSRAHGDGRSIWTLSKIVSAEKGKGIGTAAMKQIIEAADKAGATIALSPSTDFGATSVKRLQEFYSQFGFKKNTGRTADQSISESMIRTPEKPDPDIKASAGKPVATDTPEFKKWFKDSAVKGEDGKPLVVYHGTNREFNEFDESKNRDKTYPNGKKPWFFSAGEDVAKGYGSNVHESYLSIKKPLELFEFPIREEDGSETDFAIRHEDFKRLPPDLRAALAENPEGDTNHLFDRVKAAGVDISHGGYSSAWRKFAAGDEDGIIVRNANDTNGGPYGGRADVFAVFHPTQIKSATGNSGAFDPENPDIRANQSAPLPSPMTEPHPLHAHATKIDKLGGGVTDTYLAHLESGKKGVWKSASFQRPLRAAIPFSGHINREVAFSDVAETLGMGDLVPKTVRRKIDHGPHADQIDHKFGNDEGSVQEFLPETMQGKHAANPLDGPEDHSRAAALDYLMGSTDRHPGNWLLTEKPGVTKWQKWVDKWRGREREGTKLKLIDNSLSLPLHEEPTGGGGEHENGMPHFENADLLRFAVDRKIPDLSTWEWPKVEKALRDNKIENTAIELAKKRFDAITTAAREGKFFGDLPYGGRDVKSAMRDVPYKRNSDKYKRGEEDVATKRDDR